MRVLIPGLMWWILLFILLYRSRSLLSRNFLLVLVLVTLTSLIQLTNTISSTWGHYAQGRPAWAFTIVGIVGSILSLPLILLSERIGRKLFIALGLAVTAFAIATLLLLPNELGLAFSYLFLGSGGYFLLYLVYFADISLGGGFGPRDTIAVAALYLIARSLPGTGSSNVGTVLFSIFGQPTVSWVVIGLCMVGVGIAVYLLRSIQPVKSQIEKIDWNRLVQIFPNMFLYGIVLFVTSVIVAYLNIQVINPHSEQFESISLSMLVGNLIMSGAVFAYPILGFAVKFPYNHWCLRIGLLILGVVLGLWPFISNPATMMGVLLLAGLGLALTQVASIARFLAYAPPGFAAISFVLCGFLEFLGGIVGQRCGWVLLTEGLWAYAVVVIVAICGILIVWYLSTCETRDAVFDVAKNEGSV